MIVERPGDDTATMLLYQWNCLTTYANRALISAYTKAQYPLDLWERRTSGRKTTDGNALLGPHQVQAGPRGRCFGLPKLAQETTSAAACGVSRIRYSAASSQIDRYAEVHVLFQTWLFRSWALPAVDEYKCQLFQGKYRFSTDKSLIPTSIETCISPGGRTLADTQISAVNRDHVKELKE